MGHEFSRRQLEVDVAETTRQMFSEQMFNLRKSPALLQKAEQFGGMLEEMRQRNMLEQGKTKK